MPDKLKEMFDAWQASVSNPGGLPLTEYQAFQGGVTSGAVSMRKRAMDIVAGSKLKDKDRSDLLSAIGSLSDIG